MIARPKAKLRDRAQQRGAHSQRHIDRQRLIALLMIGSGLLRVCVWASMLGLYALNIGGVRHLYSEVSFVTILSILALLLTDWGQVAASLAQLTAGDAHHDAEAARKEATKQRGDATDGK